MKTHLRIDELGSYLRYWAVWETHANYPRFWPRDSVCVLVLVYYFFRFACSSDDGTRFLTDNLVRNVVGCFVRLTKHLTAVVNKQLILNIAWKNEMMEEQICSPRICRFQCGNQSVIYNYRSVTTVNTVSIFVCGDRSSISVAINWKMPVRGTVVCVVCVSMFFDYACMLQCRLIDVLRHVRPRKFIFATCFVKHASIMSESCDRWVMLLE